MTEPEPAAALSEPAAPATGARIPGPLPRELALPPECACCGAVASRSTREVALLDARSVRVPYCEPCHAHASRAATRRLAVLASSALLAVTCALGLPFLVAPSSALVYAALVALGVALPPAASRLVARAPGRGHAASGRALWFTLDGSLAGARGAFVERVAAAAGSTAVPVHARESPLSRGLLGVAAAAAAAVPLLYRLHFPIVRIVNVSDRTLSVLVDGRAVGSVAPTSAESPTAGLAVRVPAGRRRIEAVDAARAVVDAADVYVEPGETHLYAPASRGTCFWVESTGYGRMRGGEEDLEPLTGEPRFWAIPGGIDVWFAAAPPPDDDASTTGGLLRALRQARCEEAPAAVR